MVGPVIKEKIRIHCDYVQGSRESRQVSLRRNFKTGTVSNLQKKILGWANVIKVMKWRTCE